MLADVVDVLVYLVGNDDDALVAEQHVLQRLKLLLAVDRARGIAGRAQDEGTRAGRDGSIKLLGRNLEVLFDGCLHEDRCAFCQQDHLRIAHPVGSRDDDFVAGIYEGHDGVADALLGTVAAKNLRRSVVQSVLILELCNDSLLQFGVAWHGAVAAVVVLYGFDGGCLDVVGRVEVGFAHAHVDDVYAFGFKLAAALAHGKRCAG